MPKSSITTTNHCIEKSSVSRPLLRPKSLGLASRSTSKFEYLNSQSETLDWWIADSFWIGFGSWTAVFALKLNLSKEKNELCLLSYVSRYANLDFHWFAQNSSTQNQKACFWALQNMWTQCESQKECLHLQWICTSICSFESSMIAVVQSHRQRAGKGQRKHGKLQKTTIYNIYIIYYILYIIYYILYIYIILYILYYIIYILYYIIYIYYIILYYIYISLLVSWLVKTCSNPDNWIILEWDD